jgi:hypothetical protein
VDPVDAIARAVLYEGYLLYPYTRSAAKNQVRWTFGGVYPPSWPADPSVMQTECLLRAGPDCRLNVLVRCLQLVPSAEPGWQEAEERTVAELEANVTDLASRIPIELPGIQGEVAVSAVPVEGGALKLTVRIENKTSLPLAGRVGEGVPNRETALLHALVSTHTVLRASGGEFASLADPPADLRAAASGCVNQGTWPVLVGEPGSLDTVLSSPIILEDYPRVAEESPGDLFDSTEIDEILTLRILTLTEEEKAEVRRTDERGRRLLERTESLTADELTRLHGALRGLRAIEGPEL